VRLLEIGGWKLEVGGWRLEVVGWKGCRLHTLVVLIFFIIILIILSACAPADAQRSTLDAGQLSATDEQSLIPNPQSLIPSLTPPPPSTSTPLHPTSTPCPPDICAYAGHFILARPIAPPGVDAIDPTYRYGSTQAGLRETHHGVEFVNPQGTPVLAAADGVVIVAGDDFRTPYADYPGFYGNLVIIEHPIPNTPYPIYTLYGHLYEVQAAVGQQVFAGDQIGLVGFTGWAVGEHLHFEVRYGENSYRKTRNPELWLQPYFDENGAPHGAIAGRIVDEFGAPIPIPSISIEYLAPEGDGVLATYYLESYADWTVNGDDTLGENFVLGDLPVGRYRVSFVVRGLQVYEVDVLPGQVTLIVFDARGLEG